MLRRARAQSCVCGRWSTVADRCGPLCGGCGTWLQGVSERAAAVVAEPERADLRYFLAEAHRVDRAGPNLSAALEGYAAAIEMDPLMAPPHYGKGAAHWAVAQQLRADGHSFEQPPVAAELVLAAKAFATAAAIYPPGPSDCAAALLCGQRSAMWSGGAVGAEGEGQAVPRALSLLWLWLAGLWVVAAPLWRRTVPHHQLPARSAPPPLRIVPPLPPPRAAQR
eukprot:SAG11_NODE_1628_length_4547_cov_24.204178_6_plen_223_part_00